MPFLSHCPNRSPFGEITNLLALERAGLDLLDLCRGENMYATSLFPSDKGETFMNTHVNEVTCQ